jgi:hypothetical protein
MNARAAAFGTVIALLLASSLFAQRVPERYERVLVPVLPLGTWSADLWIHNDGSEAADIFPLVSDADSLSRGSRFPLLPPGVPPGQTLEYFSLTSVSSLRPYYMPLSTTFAGGILYVERGKADDVRFQLRVGDTEVPVVREAQFATSTLSLLRVPVRGNRYYTLRVYSLDSENVDVEVTFEPVGSFFSVASEHLQLQRPDTETRCASNNPCPWPDLPFSPTYAAFVFDTARVREWTYRITVTSRAGARIWAFLSATDKLTRDIRIYSPN